MTVDAIMIKEADNVATALREIRPGETVLMGIGARQDRIEVRESIPYGHKFAAQDIAKGDPIIKYGEVMGRATQAIGAGCHAHIQNIESLRGRGDLASGEEA
jgi:altronate dehydratase small subunit